MFVVDEATAEAIRRAYEEGGELAGIVEFKRHFPLIADNARAQECARIIAGWQPVPEQPEAEPKRRRAKTGKSTAGGHAELSGMPALVTSATPSPARDGRGRSCPSAQASR